MLKAVQTSYQLFMGADCAGNNGVLGRLVLLARLEDCLQSDENPDIFQTEGEGGIPLTAAIGKLTRTKQAGEMIFGAFESVYPIGTGIKLPCGMQDAPNLEGKTLKISGELQLHIAPEIGELDTKPVRIGKITPCSQTELGDMVVSLEGIEIVG